MSIKQLVFLRVHELILVLKLYLARVLSLFYRDENLWLISERGKEARDNAYFFFVWLKNNHPEINAKYVISRDSKDMYKFQQWQDSIVYYDTFNHLASIWKATHLISTHICGYTTDISFFPKFDKLFNIFANKKKVFLQHGIIMNDIDFLYGNNIHLDLFCCGAKPEYEFVCSKYNHPKNVVKYTGLCRYDNLNDFNIKNQILLMPTWRTYLSNEDFPKSEYYQKFKSLVASKRMRKLLQNSGCSLVFYPHFNVQPYLHFFQELDLPKEIVIAGFDYDVQTLLKESKMLITDYSSVYFDMLYMAKPVIFYQFDKENFHSFHYPKGYIKEEEYGEVVKNEDDLMDALEKIISNEFIVDSQYLQNIEKLFPLRGSENCSRTYSLIKQL